MDDLQFQVKTFSELDSEQLYALLKLRSEVFVVEQDCVYLDLDDRDQQASHVLGLQQGDLLCYARLLPPGSRFAEPSIGRVVSAGSVRRAGCGRQLMQAAIAACQQQWPGQGIRISAQQYLEAFYQSLGFETCSAPYLEDGIDHVEMRLPGDSAAA
jgi:ElaA protein